ncbi:MAG: peptide deformylase, partial [Parcubacteria group bacterium]
MAELTIITYPNPILRQKTQAILDVKKPAMQKLIKDMLETMEKNNGVGLAAPQVGQSLRLCVIRVEEVTYILANPRITYTSRKKEVDIEGCLSFPEKFIAIQRSEQVRIKALNELGEEVIIKAKGLLSRALQHEIDHLDGTVFIDRDNKSKKNKLTKLA